MYLQKAVVIAQKTLADCTTKIGLTAGAHHFVDLWARDSLFASFGAARDTTKQTIETFLQYQKKDGCIPYRIRRARTTVGKYFGKPRYFHAPKSDFISHQTFGFVPDGGLMTIIAAKQYDDAFFNTHKEKLHKTIDWYIQKYKGDLIWEWFQCEWADAVLKFGYTLYTNILYWKALGDMSLFDRQNLIGNRIREKFWNGVYFADWIDYKRHDYFASYANMLAIVFGFANKKESERILSYAKKYCWNNFTLETNFPRYPWWRIPFLNYFVGMADYHNRGCLWLQPGMVYALALYKTGKKNESRLVLEKISRKIIQYNEVYEVYEKDGKPVMRKFYRSEGPFAWSAGFYLWAYSHIYGTA